MLYPLPAPTDGQLAAELATMPWNPPVGSTSPDVTASRALTTSFKNGPLKRFVLIYATCASSALGAANLVMHAWTAGGVNLSAGGEEVGPGATSGTVLCCIAFWIDPGSFYQVNAIGGSQATITLVKWYEVDG